MTDASRTATGNEPRNIDDWMLQLSIGSACEGVRLSEHDCTELRSCIAGLERDIAALRMQSAVQRGEPLHCPVAFIGRRMSARGTVDRESVSFDRQQLLTIGYDELEIAPLYMDKPSSSIAASELEKLLDQYDEALLGCHDDQLSRSGAREADKHCIEVRQKMLLALGIASATKGGTDGN